MLRRGLLAAAFFVCGCRPWCATPAELWTPSAYGSEAAAVAATDAFIAEQVRLGLSRPGEELDRAARSLGAADAGELARVREQGCLTAENARRFAAARGLSSSTASAYLADRFGVAPCLPR